MSNGPRTEASASTRRLEGWKEIGAYFGRDQRTAQRWEKEGLPVFREAGKVFAQTAELDTWRSSRQVSSDVEPGSNEPLDEPGASDDAELPEAPVGIPAPRSRRLPGPLFAALMLAIALATAWIFWPKEAILVSTRQLTRDNRYKIDRVVSDGKRIFFTELDGATEQVAYVPVAGGQVTKAPLAIGAPAVLAFSAARRSLLIEDQRSHRLFEASAESFISQEIPLPDGITAAAASWDPNGRRLAVTGLDRLAVIEPGKQASPSQLQFPGSAVVTAWDTLRRELRLEVDNAHIGATAWYDVDTTHLAAHRIPALSPKRAERRGGWSDDGRFFVFRTDDGEAIGPSQIWIADYSRGAPPSSYPITADDRAWQDPGFLPGSYTVIARSAPSQGRLVWLSTTRQQGAPRPVLPEAPAYELDYSRDGQWIAYTRYPEQSIWRCRIDGSEPRQLTPPGIEAHQPHWSPDGTRIAFMGRRLAAGQRWRIYLVPSHGGALDETMPEGDDQGVPTWSPDGTRIVFGDRKTSSGFDRASIHELNLTSSTLSTIPAPAAMWSPRMSPDGRHLAAVGYDNKSLFLRDNIRNTWRKCAAMDFVEEPSWPSDSSFVQFIGLVKSGDEALFRVSPACEAPKLIVGLSDYRFVGGAWIGIGPDNTPMGLLRIPDEIYALDWRLRRRLP